jgi:tetratricopeptide (TPR) repeat protein
MNYHSLFSTLSLALLLQVSSTFLLSSCSDQKPLQQNSSPTSGQLKPQENLTGISKTIQDKAKQFTVRIDSSDENGSGVIVAKNGETYYVLTAKHVVEQDQEYKLVTPDEKEYNVDAGKIKTLEGADLAVLQFQSGEMYQVATLAEYKREFEENSDNNQKMMAESTKQLTDMSKITSLKEMEKQIEDMKKQAEEDMKKSQANTGKLKESQYLSPWLFLFGWQRFNNTPQLRLTSGRDMTTRLGSYMGKSKQVNFASQSFDSLARSQSYQLSYTNFSQGGMSGGPVMDTLGRVIGIHAGAEGEISGLEQIQLGFSWGIPTKTVLSSISQTGIKPEWLKVEKVRPPRITKADEQSITKNLLDIEPPGKDATEADWLNYGNELWRIKRYPEATAAFDEAIKRKPDFYQAYFGKGLVIEMQEAERLLQGHLFGEDLVSSMASLEVPQSSSSEKELPPEASFEAKMQEFDAERQEFDRYLDTINQKLEQDTKKSAGNLTSRSQGLAKALPFYKKATEINPDFYPAWREIGRINYLEVTSQQMSDLSETIGGATATEITLSPKETQTAKEALAALNKATALEPSDIELYRLKGDVLQQLSRHQEAIDAYSKAIKIDPTTLLYSMRSSVYCSIGDKQKAEADMKSAEKLGYQNAAKDLPVCGQGQGVMDYYNQRTNY